jgi:hypothetical protein
MFSHSAACRYACRSGITGATSAISAGRIGMRLKLPGSSPCAKLCAVRSKE